MFFPGAVMRDIGFDNALFTAKTQNRKFETNIPRKGIAWPQSLQSLFHIHVSWSDLSHHRAAYSAAGKYMDRSWKYKNRSQTHECGNWDGGHTIPFLGTHKWDYRCSVGLELHYQLKLLTFSFRSALSAPRSILLAQRSTLSAQASHFQL